VQAMIDAGFITEEQGIGHPDANKITRALGMKPEVDVELRPEPMELFPGDLLLTASDGLTDLALPKDILGATRQALASGGLEHGCEQLVRMANDRGGHDNITVQLVRVIGTAAQRTRTGATQAGAMQTTVHDAGGPANAPQPQQAMHHAAATPYPAAVAHRDAAPNSMGGHQLTSHTPPQPAVDTVLGRGHHETIPMQPAATAHDGTNRSSSAAYPGHPAAHSGAPGHGPQGTLPLAQRPQGPQNMAAYRADGVGALGLPPTAARPDMRRPAPTPHDAGGWQQRPAGPSASGVESVPGRSGGRVLFMALAISFIVAVVAIALAWLVFIR
jgi:PPM family protein phosphatase